MSVFEKVYEVLLRIPKGKVTTYGRIAEMIGTTPRVVGFALNKNPHPIVVPCHRVVGSNGNLVGYAGGINKKRELLEKERVKFKDRMHVDLNSSLWLLKS